MHASLKTIHPKHLPEPWITPEIKTLMERRNKQRKIWQRQKNNTIYVHFKTLRNQVQNMIRGVTQEFYMTVFANTYDPADIWRKLRQLGLVRSKI